MLAHLKTNMSIKISSHRFQAALTLYLCAMNYPEEQNNTMQNSMKDLSVLLYSYIQTEFFILKSVRNIMIFLCVKYMSDCQSIVIKLMNFPTLVITTQNSNSLNQMS